MDQPTKNTITQESYADNPAAKTTALKSDSEAEVTERQRMYESFFKDAMNRAKSNQEAQDKMILTISAALFGIMPFILEKLQPTCFNKVFIFIFLLSNTLCLISVILSFWFCAKGNMKDVKFAEKYYLQGKEKSFNKKSKWTKYGEKCNQLSLISIIIVFIVFAIMMGKYFINK